MMSIALLLTSMAFAKTVFPTPPAENETIEQSIGRIRHDEVMGEQMVKREQEDFKKATAAHDTKKAAALRSEIVAHIRELKDLRAQRQTLIGMMEKMKAPLKPNTSVQPGVSQAPGSLSVSMPPASNLLPATPAPPGAIPAQPIQVAPGQQPPPAAQPGQAPPSSGN